MDHEIYYTQHNDKLKCVICFQNHDNVPHTLLNKICICEDSIICTDCLKGLKINKIIKCPICRRKLTINRSYYIVSNIFIFIRFNKLLITYILNILITNLVIYYLYYSKGHYIPDKLYNDIEELDSDNKLLMRKIILLNKNSFFIINNLIICVCYPLITQVCNNIFYSYNIRQRLQLIGYILFILVMLNLLLVSILIIDSSINGLIIYFQFNMILYSLYSICVFTIYIVNYLSKKFNFIKENYMNFNIEYNILNKIYYILDDDEYNNDEQVQDTFFINDISVV